MEEQRSWTWNLANEKKGDPSDIQLMVSLKKILKAKSQLILYWRTGKTACRIRLSETDQRMKMICDAYVFADLATYNLLDNQRTWETSVTDGICS